MATDNTLGFLKWQPLQHDESYTSYSRIVSICPHENELRLWSASAGVRQVFRMQIAELG